MTFVGMPPPFNYAEQMKANLENHVAVSHNRRKQTAEIRRVRDYTESG